MKPKNITANEYLQLKAARPGVDAEEVRLWVLGQELEHGNDATKTASQWDIQFENWKANVKDTNQGIC